ncbi:MAG: transposase, partial [Chromatiaceae bacterium]
MARRKRRNHAPAFKAQVALAAIKGDKTLAELAQQHDLHPNQITDWQTQLLERAAQVFDGVREPDISGHLRLVTYRAEVPHVEKAKLLAGVPVRGRQVASGART